MRLRRLRFGLRIIRVSSLSTFRDQAKAISSDVESSYAELTQVLEQAGLL